MRCSLCPFNVNVKIVRVLIFGWEPALLVLQECSPTPRITWYSTHTQLIIQKGHVIRLLIANDVSFVIVPPIVCSDGITMVGMTYEGNGTMMWENIVEHPNVAGEDFLTSMLEKWYSTSEVSNNPFDCSETKSCSGTKHPCF